MKHRAEDKYKMVIKRSSDQTPSLMADRKNMPCDRDRIEGGLLLTRAKVPKKTISDRPLVTIVTAVRDGEKALEQTIQSVLNQTYDNIEYIIIDGASTDRTLEIIQQYENKITYWLSEPDQGIYDAMNKGILTSSGTLINLLNADDYLESDAVDLVVKRYLELNQSCVVYGNAHILDENFSVRTGFRSSLKCWRGMTVNHQSMFVHKDVYKKIGLYDTRYKLAADYEFFVRIVNQNIAFLPLDRYIVSYRNSGISTTDPRLKKEAFIINKEYYGSFSKKRLIFLFLNYVWSPLKIGTRTFLYNVIGVCVTRRIISMYKKTLKL